MRSFVKWPQNNYPSCDGSKYFHDIADTNIDYGNIKDILHSGKQQLLLTQGIVVDVEPMTSEQYLEQCSVVRGHRPSLPENEHACVNPGKIDHYAQLMKKGEKFPLPMLNYVFGNQDGRHRALAALANHASKIPVITFKYSGDDYLRQFADYPDSWKSTQGLFIDNANNRIVADCRHCKTIDDIKHTIERARTTYNTPLTESMTKDTKDIGETFIRRISALSAGSDIQKNKAVLTLDNDGDFRVSLITQNAGKYDVFANGTLYKETFHLTDYNLWRVCQSLSGAKCAEDLWKVCYRLKQDQPSTDSSLNISYLQNTFIDQILLNFTGSYKYVGSTYVVMIDVNPMIKIEFIIEGNRVTFEHNITNYYIGTIDVVGHAADDMINSFDKVIRSVNQTKSIRLLDDFVRRFK